MLNKIIMASENDAVALTKLTFRSKAHWPYSKGQLEEWYDDLEITSKYISTNEVFKLVEKELLVAYYSYYKIGKESIFLDNLFVEPIRIGKGYGKLLLEHCFLKARNEGCKKILLESDPNSEKFYEKFGFKTIEYKESTVKGRFLPIMEINL